MALPAPLSSADILPVSEEASQTSDDALQERIALIHYAGGVPLVWTEGFARLCAMSCPASFNGRQLEWQSLIDNTGRFLDRWGRQAAELGWQAHDLFAVHQTAPLRRYDCMGLLPCLQAHSVLAMTEDSATLQSSTGAQLTFSRRVFDRSLACLVWEL